jgi:methionyl-tRNA formyltransferase
MGADLLSAALAGLQAGTLRARPQDHTLATLAPRIGREMCRIRWTDDCRGIVSLIRGLSPAPCAFTSLDGKQFKIFTATAEPDSPAEPPGTVVGETAELLRVAAGTGQVLLKEVQLEGKKRMGIKDFLLGHPSILGKTLGWNPI